MYRQGLTRVSTFANPLIYCKIAESYIEYLFTKKYQVFSKAAKLFLNRLEANIGRL